jgi:tetratricopeptide (TPR) repeat protein
MHRARGSRQDETRMSGRTILTVALIAISGGMVPLPGASSGHPAPDAVAEDTLVRGEVYALLMDASLAERRGEYRTAGADIRRAIELKPDEPDVLIQAAELLESMGRVKESDELARRSLTLDGDHVATLYFLADRASAAVLGATKPDPKQRDEALALYKRLVDLGVKDDEVLRKVVNLRLSAGDQVGALAAAKQLVAQRPGDRQAVAMLGQLLLDSGESREALRVVVSYVADHPNDSPLIRLAEELAQDLDAWDLVEEVFSAGEGFEGQPVEAQRLLGQALLKLDRFEPASRALEQLLVSDPEDRNVRFHLARTYRRMGRLGEAADLARDLAQEVPADRQTHLLLAEILDDQDDAEGALNAYNTALRLSSSAEGEEAAHGAEIREAIRRRMILLYLSQDQIAAASRLYEQMEAPQSAETLHVRARLAIAREDWTDAKQAVRELRAANEPTAASLLEAEWMLRTDHLQRAVPKIDEAIQASGGGARVRAAALYKEAGRVAEGERVLRDWVTAEPESTDARFQLGAYLYQAERFDESTDQMREVFRLDPKHGPALNFLGYGFAERGTNLEEALGLVQRALAVDPWNGAYLDSLGWVYFRMGRYDEARQPLEQAARTFPHDATVLDHLGDVYRSLGERELAVAAWTRAIDAGATDAPALRAKIDVFEVAGQPDDRKGQTDSDDPGATQPEPRRP